MKKIMMLILILLFAVPAFGVTINATTSSTKQVNKRDTASKVTYTGATVTAGSTQVFRLSSPNSYGYVKQPTFLMQVIIAQPNFMKVKPLQMQVKNPL